MQRQVRAALQGMQIHSDCMGDGPEVSGVGWWPEKQISAALLNGYNETASWQACWCLFRLLVTSPESSFSRRALRICGSGHGQVAGCMFLEAYRCGVLMLGRRALQDVLELSSNYLQGPAVLPRPGATSDSRAWQQLLGPPAHPVPCHTDSAANPKP